MKEPYLRVVTCFQLINNMNDEPLKHLQHKVNDKSCIQIVGVGKLTINQFPLLTFSQGHITEKIRSFQLDM